MRNLVYEALENGYTADRDKLRQWGVYTKGEPTPRRTTTNCCKACPRCRKQRCMACCGLSSKATTENDEATRVGVAVTLLVEFARGMAAPCGFASATKTAR